MSVSVTESKHWMYWSFGSGIFSRCGMLGHYMDMCALQLQSTSGYRTTHGRRIHTHLFPIPLWSWVGGRLVDSLSYLLDK